MVLSIGPWCSIVGVEVNLTSSADGGLEVFVFTVYWCKHDYFKQENFDKHPYNWSHMSALVWYM